MARPTSLTVLQGSTWSQGWEVTWLDDPLPATWSVRAQVRATTDPDDDTVLAEWDSTDATTLPCSVAEGGIVTLGVPAEDSSAWTWTKGKYDVEVVSPDEETVLRVDWGTIRVKPEVTR